ncbi:MAG: hypothetical protein FJ297_01225 [Planctomycetes bacterium]|nr:hypothetical protein [Planctomycetota bacterium]
MLLRWLVGNYLRQSAESAAARTFAAAARIARPGDRSVRIPDHYRTAVAFGLAIESDGFRAILDGPATYRGDAGTEHWGPLNGMPIRVVETGAGADRAARGILDAIGRSKPDWVVSAGFATALSAELGRGDLILAERVRGESGAELRIPFHLPESSIRETPRLHVGSLVSLSNVLTTPDARREAAARFGAIAADQDTMGVAEICARERIRFLSVRIVTDAIDDILPPEVAGWLSRKSVAGKLGVAAGTVFKDPERVASLWRLADTARAASRRLAGFLTGIVRQLGPEPSR